MYIARILYPIKVLGPGNRIGIWFNGCSRRCKGCSNPELQDLNEAYSVSLANVKKLINKIANMNSVDGFTITGGDPFEQPVELSELLDYIRTISEDIIVYTGYKFDYIKEKHEDIVKKIAVLIDGEYQEELNKGDILRGSENQQIIVLDDRYNEKYLTYIENHTSDIQNFYINNAVISVGIHKPGFEAEIDEMMKRKGLIHDE